MSIDKRIQALTQFISQLEQFDNIPEIKKQKETLTTALKTLKAFSNDKQILKTTLQVMKQTNELIKKYGAEFSTEKINKKINVRKVKPGEYALRKYGNGIIEEDIQQEIPCTEIDNEEQHNEELINVRLQEEIDGGIDGRCAGGYDGGGVIEEFTNESGGEGGSATTNFIQKNFETLETEKLYKKKITTADLQSLPIDVILALNDILLKFRKERESRQ